MVSTPPPRLPPPIKKLETKSLACECDFFLNKKFEMISLNHDFAQTNSFKSRSHLSTVGKLSGGPHLACALISWRWSLKCCSLPRV